MHKVILVILLAVMSGSAMAEWILISPATDGSGVYADPTTIRKSGSVVKMWELYDLSTAHEINSKKKLMSTKVQSEWDCKEERKRNLYLTGYAESMGKGELLISGNSDKEWIPIIPGSMDALVWKYACGE